MNAEERQRRARERHHADDWVEVEVGGVTVDADSQTPVVVLKALEDAAWFLPIFIGGTEATAIAASVAGVRLPRPITHDLFSNVLLIGDVHMECGTVVSVVDGTFIAAAEIVYPSGERITFDARPSDVIALALRCDAPLFIARDVMVEAGAFAPEPIAAPDPAGADAAEADVATAPTRADRRPRSAGGQPVPLLSADVRLEDLDPSVFGKYKM